MKLYDISPDDPDRRAFLDKYIQFQEEKGTPISQCPTISKLPLDLYRLYVAVKERGGFVEVTRGKLWKECTQICNIASSSSAAYTLRKQYIKHLLAFECKFDRGGIDPITLLSSVEGSNRKKNKNQPPPEPPSFQAHSNNSSADGFTSGSYPPQNYPPPQMAMVNNEYSQHQPPPPPHQPPSIPSHQQNAYPPPPQNYPPPPSSISNMDYPNHPQQQPQSQHPAIPPHHQNSYPPQNYPPPPTGISNDYSHQTPQSQPPPPPPPVPSHHQNAYPLNSMSGTHNSRNSQMPLVNHNESVSVQDPFADDVQHNSAYSQRNHPPTSSSMPPTLPHQAPSNVAASGQSDYNYNYQNSGHNSYYNSVPPQPGHPSIPPTVIHDQYNDYTMGDSYNRQAAKSQPDYPPQQINNGYPPNRVTPSPYFNQPQISEQNRPDSRFDHTRPPSQDSNSNSSNSGSGIYGTQQQQQQQGQQPTTQPPPLPPPPPPPPSQQPPQQPPTPTSQQQLPQTPVPQQIPGGPMHPQPRGQYPNVASGQSQQQPQPQQPTSNSNYVRGGPSPISQYGSMGQQSQYPNSSDNYRYNEINNSVSKCSKLIFGYFRNVFCACSNQLNQFTYFTNFLFIYLFFFILF